jgi:hypothetical protein
VCVGLQAAPKGKWFCPICTEIKKKRKEKHLQSLLGIGLNSISDSGDQIISPSCSSALADTASSKICFPKLKTTDTPTEFKDNETNLKDTIKSLISEDSDSPT